MRKILLSLSLVTSILLAEADNANTLLNTAVNDIVFLNNYSKENLQKLSQNEEFLKEFTQKVNNYENEVSQFTHTQIEAFSSKEEAKNALENMEKLSYESVALAKIAAYLASHHADNANQSYNNTLTTLTKTTLRLSDDIGKMADRIGEMADRIGVMADRIIKTQQIQSNNYQETLKLSQYTLTLLSQNKNQTQNMIVEQSANLNSAVHKAAPAPTQQSNITPAIQQAPAQSQTPTPTQTPTQAPTPPVQTPHR